MWGPLLSRSPSELCGEGAPLFLHLTSGRVTRAAVWLLQMTAWHRERLENIAGKDRAGRTEKVAMTDIRTMMWKIANQWEAAVEHREPSLALCDGLEGWDGSRKEGSRWRGYIYLMIADLHCPATATNTAL